MTPALKAELEQISGRAIPKHDVLEWLIDKMLPEYGKVTLTHDFGHKQWWAVDVIGHDVFNADTPTEAVARLCVKLFQQNILTKEQV